MAISENQNHASIRFAPCLAIFLEFSEVTNAG
jgi:hypothetical protein